MAHQDPLRCSLMWLKAGTCLDTGSTSCGLKKYFIWTQEVPHHLRLYLQLSYLKILLNNTYYPSHILFIPASTERSPKSANDSKTPTARTGQKADFRQWGEVTPLNGRLTKVSGEVGRGGSQLTSHIVWKKETAHCNPAAGNNVRREMFSILFPQ